MTETLMLKRWVGLVAFFAIPLLAACSDGPHMNRGPTYHLQNRALFGWYYAGRA